MLDSTGTLVVTAGFLYVETETKGRKQDTILAGIFTGASGLRSSLSCNSGLLEAALPLPLTSMTSMQPVLSITNKFWPCL